jgi:glycerate 2-kinase
VRVLLAPDKFKGSLTAYEVGAALAKGISDAAPSTVIDQVPVADGGDGTLDAAYAAGYDRVAIRVDGPTGEPVDTAYARRGDRAVVELAATCGLSLLPGGRLAATTASSYGVGQAIAAALDAGCRDLVLGIGGSASTDGGAGMVSALGAQVLDASGDECARGGGPLAAVASIDLDGLHPALRSTRLVVACDVDNPLTGPRGAAAVYGPQKGATDLAALDANLGRWATVVARTTGSGHADDPGAGAAGGVGFAAVALLGARLAPGIALLLDLVGFTAALGQADLVVTGEGSLDEQTLNGKAPAGVAAAARARGIPTVAVAGRCLLSADQLAAAGIERAYALADLEPDPVRSMADAAQLLDRVAHDLARDWIITS